MSLDLTQFDTIHALTEGIKCAVKARIGYADDPNGQAEYRLAVAIQQVLAGMPVEGPVQGIDVDNIIQETHIRLSGAKGWATEAARLTGLTVSNVRIKWKRMNSTNPLAK